MLDYAEVKELNRNVVIGGLLVLLALAIELLSGFFYAGLASLLFLVGIVFIGYGAWKSLGHQRKDRNATLGLKYRALVVGALILIAFAAAFVFLPVEPANGPCNGGSACVHYYSLSCQAFGFGSYADFFGTYFFTYDCNWFVNH